MTQDLSVKEIQEGLIFIKEQILWIEEHPDDNLSILKNTEKILTQAIALLGEYEEMKEKLYLRLDALNKANKEIIKLQQELSEMKGRCGVEEIEKFLLEWGRKNKAFQKNAGFRKKLATQISQFIKGEK